MRAFFSPGRRCDAGIPRDGRAGTTFGAHCADQSWFVLSNLFANCSPWKRFA